MTLTARYKRRTLIINLTLFLPFVILGIFAMRDASILSLIKLLPFVVILSWLSLVDVKWLCHTGAVLTIDSNGVYYSRAVDRVVPWSSISEFKESPLPGQSIFTIILSEPVSNFTVTPFKRFIATHLSWLHSLFYMNSYGLTASADQIREALQYYAKQQVGTRGSARQSAKQQAIAT